MWRSPSRRTERRRASFASVVAAAAVCLAAVPAARAAATRPEPARIAAPAVGELALLDLRVNGIALPETVDVLRCPAGPALSLEVWTALRLRPAGTAPVQHEGVAYQRLGDLPGVRARVDEATQTLVIDAPASAFVGARFALDAPAPAVSVASAVGGYANYDLQWQRHDAPGVASRTTAGALLEAGAFGPAGTGRLTGLVRDGGAASGWVRLDTSWTIDRPAQLASLRLGDAISKPGAWGRALRFGGVQWGTDFAVQPGFLTFPLPSMQGEAVLPSTVDLYVNNSRRLQRDVPAGAFDLTEVPLVTGQGRVRMVVRDVLGREQVIEQPYYVSPALLRPGLHAVAYELGLVREDYGLASNRYGRLYAAATDRAGIGERFTRELRIESLGRQVAGGATGLWLAPALGVMNLSAVASHGPDGSGGLLGAGVDRQALDWSGSLQVRYGSRHFAQAGQGPNESPRLGVSAAVGRSWGPIAVGLNYLEQTRWRDDTRQRIVGANVARVLGSLGSLSLVALRDLGSAATTVALSFTHVIDAHTSVGAAATRQRDRGFDSTVSSVQVQRNVAEETGFGYRLSADRGDIDRQAVQGVWQGQHAVVQAGVARFGSQTETQAGVSGGLAWLGDSVFASRRIDGSFAVVEVADYPDVQLLHDNRPVARTDARGRALISGLRGYEPNRIAIDPENLPFDAEVGALEAVLTPPARSGVALRLSVQRSRSASFRLVGRDGDAVPPGSELSIDGQSRSFPVGFDGKAFVSGLSARRTQVLARWSGRSCRAWVQLDDEVGDVPELGTLRCE